MPQVPEYPLPQAEINPLPQVRVRSGFAGQGLQEMVLAGQRLGAVAGRIGGLLAEQQTAYNKAEGARIAANTLEESKNIIQQNAQTINDPDQFESTTRDALKEKFDQASTHDNAAIGEAVKQALAPHIIQSKRQIGELKFAKQRDGAKAAVGAAMQSYGNLAANGNT